MVDQVGFEQLRSSLSIAVARKIRGITAFEESWLRSWVQIPPGPFLSARELRHQKGLFRVVVGQNLSNIPEHLIKSFSLTK